METKQSKKHKHKINMVDHSKLTRWIIEQKKKVPQENKNTKVMQTKKISVYPCVFELTVPLWAPPQVWSFSVCSAFNGYAYAFISCSTFVVCAMTHFCTVFRFMFVFFTCKTFLASNYTICIKIHVWHLLVFHVLISLKHASYWIQGFYFMFCQHVNS